MGEIRMSLLDRYNNHMNSVDLSFACTSLKEKIKRSLLDLILQFN